MTISATRDKRILIIDDSKDMQSLLKMYLEHNGFQVDCTSNGAEALTHLGNAPKLPDVILLDLQMPVMDGYDFLGCQKSIQDYKDIPTIVMSAEEPTENSKVKTAGAIRLMKPLDISSVLDTVKSLIH